MNRIFKLDRMVWAVAMLLGVSAAQGAAGIQLEVESRHAAGGRAVIRHELARELADRLGGAPVTLLEAREAGASAEAAAWPAELLFPEERTDGRATLLLAWPGAQAAGAIRRLTLSAAPDAVRAPTDLRFEQADGLLRVGNGHFEVTHDLQKGGAIVAVTYPDGTRVDVKQRDGVRGYSLAQDKAPTVTVLGRPGGLGASVEIEARFLDRGAQHEALTVRYRYLYTADSPWIRLEAELPEQTPGQVHTQVRLLDLEFATKETLPESVPLITASSGPAYGGLIPQREKLGGDHRPRAGTLWYGPAWALAWAQPVLNEDFVHEWSGERQILSASLYLGPAETAADNLLRAEGPLVRVMLPALAERLAAGQAAAAELTGAPGALAQALLAAARQRMEDSYDLVGLRELLVAGEAVLAAPPAADGVAQYETDRFLALAN
ncbi:MAG: hypothetical protein K9N49_03575, partial [Candidatus Marinimicrobia bacterium]|nr:hypothetical protein [Candidatus Neomarinimicrobiota bacterium]